MSSTIEEGVSHEGQPARGRARRRPPRGRAQRAGPRDRSAARAVAHPARHRARGAHEAAPGDVAALAQWAEGRRVARRRGRVVGEDAREEAGRVASSRARRWGARTPGSPGASRRAAGRRRRGGGGRRRSVVVVGGGSVVVGGVVVVGGGGGAVVVGGGAGAVGGRRRRCRPRRRVSRRRLVLVVVLRLCLLLVASSCACACSRRLARVAATCARTGSARTTACTAGIPGSRTARPAGPAARRSCTCARSAPGACRR